MLVKFEKKGGMNMKSPRSFSNCPVIYSIMSRKQFYKAFKHKE